MSRRYSKEDLEKAVSRSTNIAEVVRCLGLASSNHRSIKRKISRLGLNTSHFKPTDYLRGIRAWIEGRRKSDAEIFKEHSTADRGTVVRRYKAKTVYRCAKCGLQDLWQGEGLVLQLEHKNGVRDDHRLENLCWLCPNCHSQTTTFAGRKNRGTGKVRVSVSKPRPRKVDPEAVKLQFGLLGNFKAVGREFGISDNAVKKIVGDKTDREKQRQVVAARRKKWMDETAVCRCGNTKSLIMVHKKPGEKIPSNVWRLPDEARKTILAECAMLCRKCWQRRNVENGLIGTHGSNGYDYGCRCDICRKASNEEVNNWKRRRKAKLESAA